MYDPKDKHWKEVKRILRYLKGTTDHGLKLNVDKHLNIIGYTDAD